MHWRKRFELVIKTLIAAILMSKLVSRIHSGCPPKNREAELGLGTFEWMTRHAIRNNYWGSGALRFLDGKPFCFDLGVEVNKSS